MCDCERGTCRGRGAARGRVAQPKLNAFVRALKETEYSTSFPKVMINIHRCVSFRKHFLVVHSVPKVMSPHFHSKCMYVIKTFIQSLGEISPAAKW